MQLLDRPVADLATHSVVDVSGTTTLREAACMLEDEAVGSLLVDETRGTLGIITERDLVRALADGVDPDDARVEEYLTDDLLTVEPTATILDVLQKMRDNEIRHVVVRSKGHPAGVVSMRAVVDALVDGLVEA